MKIILVLFSVLCLLSFQSEKAGLLTVSISNIKKTGKIKVAVYKDGEDFPNDKFMVKAETKECAGEACTLQFKSLPFGEYAVAIYQDVNSNGTLDTSTFGIPSEPFAFSNNFRPRWGGPTYEKCKFQFIKDKQVVEINMINSLFGGN